ncbi:MAG: hypothetical protein ACOC16_00075 [Nanoarchaeota archaeon]
MKESDEKNFNNKKNYYKNNDNVSNQNFRKISNKFDFQNKYFYILFRYLLLIFLIFFFQTDFFNNILIVIFTFISYFLLKNVTQVELLENSLLINNEYLFLIVEECIAPSAYIFISLIFLSIPIEMKNIFNILIRSIILFSFINFIRIFLLMLTHIYYGVILFEKLHMIFYEIVSGIILFFIIIYYLKKEKIRKKYPFISDIQRLIFSFRKKD